MSWKALTILAVVAMVAYATALRHELSQIVGPLEAQIRNEVYQYLTHPELAIFSIPHDAALEVSNAIAQVPGILVTFVIIVVIYTAVMSILFRR